MSDKISTSPFVEVTAGKSYEGKPAIQISFISVTRGQATFCGLEYPQAASLATQLIGIVQPSFYENLAAISAEFHSNKNFGRFYDEHGASMGGFPAIWAWMIELANAFTQAEAVYRLKNEWDGEWIDCIFEYTQLVHDAAKGGKYLSTNDLNEIATKAIHNITVEDVKIREESGAKSFSKVPGKPIKPIMPVVKAVLVMEDEDTKEGDEPMYWDGKSWTARDRSDILSESKTFKSANAAKRAFKKLGPYATTDRVWIQVYTDNLLSDTIMLKSAEFDLNAKKK